MPVVLTIYPSNSMFLDVTEVQTPEGTAIGDATVEVTLTDDVGTNLTGQTWPAEGALIAGTTNDYRVLLEDDLELPGLGGIKAEVVVTVTIATVPYRGESTEIVQKQIRREAVVNG